MFKSELLLGNNIVFSEKIIIKYNLLKNVTTYW